MVVLEVSREEVSWGGKKAHLPVAIPQASSTAFTPTFGPTSDSSFSTGGIGFHATLKALHERARHQEWSRRGLYQTEVGVLNHEVDGWWGSIGNEHEQVVKEADSSMQAGRNESRVHELLTDNAAYIHELQSWQNVRLRKGNDQWFPHREEIVGK